VAGAQRQSLTFRAYDESAVQQALASGRPVILDFAADWCIPCHELERSTFSDPRVIAAAGSFAVFKVDLTHTDSPEVAARTKRFRIQGVPTVVFLAPAGEVEAARFSGFLSPEKFLEKLQLVAAAAKRG
jgi:thiol:disulfide interchange protein DsbD